MVTPSAAVTTIVFVFWPTVNGWLADGDPEATVAPFTCTIAPASVTVGVIVIAVIPLFTDVV